MRLSQQVRDRSPTYGESKMDEETKYFLKQNLFYLVFIIIGLFLLLGPALLMSHNASLVSSIR